LPEKSRIAAKMQQAITRRQKAMEKAFKAWRNLIKTAAVPKRVPAVAPSNRANFRVRAFNGMNHHWQFDLET
jgi:hypothetical protein